MRFVNGVRIFVVPRITEVVFAPAGLITGSTCATHFRADDDVFAAVGTFKIDVALMNHKKRVEFRGLTIKEQQRQYPVCGTLCPTMAK